MQDCGEPFHILAVVDSPESALGFEQGIGQPFRRHLCFGPPSAHAPDLGADVPEGILDAVGVEQGCIQRAGCSETMDGQEFIPGLLQACERLSILSFQKDPQFLHDLLGGLQPFRLAKAPEEPVNLTVVAVGKVAFDVAGFVNQATLDDRIRPLLPDAFAQGLGTVSDGQGL